MLCLMARSPLVRYSFQQLTDSYAALSPRKSGWDPSSSSHCHAYPSWEQKLFCPGVSPGQGLSFLWANPGCWALTTG